MKTSYHLFTDKLLAPEGKLKDGQYSAMKQILGSASADKEFGSFDDQANRYMDDEPAAGAQDNGGSSGMRPCARNYRFRE